MGGFLTIAELEAELDVMHARYPDLTTAKDSIGRSNENRPIWAVKISKNPAGGSKPQALYLGLHHAREPISILVLNCFMWNLLENHGPDLEVTKLLENRELNFIPLLNLDGYYRNQTTNPSVGGLWRKNTRRNADGSEGVDLNRNYDYKWDLDNVGSSPKGSDGSYRGTAPFSEPETQAVRDFVKSHHFTVANS